MSYNTVQEIRDASPHIQKIQDATDDEITAWMAEAKIYLDQFCGQSFDYEARATKTVRVFHHPTIHLPKPLSGDVVATVNSAGSDPEDLTNDDHLDLYPGEWTMRYLPRNQVNPDDTLLTLTITGDWGFPTTVLEMLVAHANNLASLYATHIASTTYHNSADITNTVGAATATDLGTTITLLNELKADFNGHLSDAGHETADDANTVTAADASDSDTCVTLSLALKAAYNEHVASTTYHLAADENLDVYSVDTPTMPVEIARSHARITQRIAIRENEDDYRYHNSGFKKETWGDGFTYDLSDDELRAIIQDREAMLLSEWINYGRTVV